MTKSRIPHIQATVRSQTGTRYAARLRQNGQLPAVIYGHKKPTLHIAVNEKQIHDLLHDNAHLLQVDLADQPAESCLVKDIQWDHLGSNILHVDMARVNLTEKVKVQVSLELTGDPVGLKEAGAIMEHPLDTLEIECVATNIPEVITANIEALEVGQSLTVADLTLPSGVVAVTEPDTVIASVHVMAEQSEDLEEAGSDQPELIGRETKSEEDAQEE